MRTHEKTPPNGYRSGQRRPRRTGFMRVAGLGASYARKAKKQPRPAGEAPWVPMKLAYRVRAMRGKRTRGMFRGDLNCLLALAEACAYIHQQPCRLSTATARSTGWGREGERASFSRPARRAGCESRGGRRQTGATSHAPRAPHAAYLHALIHDKLLVEVTDALGTNRGSHSRLPKAIP